MATAASHYQRHLAQIEIGYALSFFSDTVKSDLLEYYYLVGIWPKEDQYLRNEMLYTIDFFKKKKSEWQQGDCRYLKQITFDTDGAINLWFSKDSGIQQYVNDPVLTLRPVLTKEPGPGTIFWLCGNAKAPDNAIVSGENKTNIPDELLITTCKNNKKRS